MMGQQKAGRIADIEVLRAAAILFVLVQHLSWLLPWNSHLVSAVVSRSQLWAGVDLFFCISGFVIARGLFDALERNGSAAYWPVFRAFWIKRAFRILPAAWLWLAVILALSIAFNWHSSFKTIEGNARDVLAAVFQVENFNKWWCATAPNVQCGVADAYWSLSLEEQFYLLFPICIVIFTARGLVPVLACLAIVQMITPRPLGYDLWNMTKSDAIMIGVVIAWFSRFAFYDKIGALVRPFAPILIPALLLAVVMPISAGYASGVVAAAAGGLVFIASFDDNALLPRGLRQALLYIGERSYSLYLVHIPVFLIIREIALGTLPARAFADAALPLFLIVAGCAILAAASATYRHVEVPLREYGRRLAERRPSSLAISH